MMKLFMSVFCVTSTHVCHNVFHACLRFIQEHICYLIPSLLIYIEGTCRREPRTSRTFQNNTVNNSQCCWQTRVAVPNTAACVSLSLKCLRRRPVSAIRLQGPPHFCRSQSCCLLITTTSSPSSLCFDKFACEEFSSLFQ